MILKMAKFYIKKHSKQNLELQMVLFKGERV